MTEITEQEFRDIGFTAEAINYPLSDRAFAWLCKFNGLTQEQAPRAFRYAPNAYMQKYLDDKAAKQ